MKFFKEFEHPQIPQFKDNVVNVCDFISEGKDITKAIEKAIDTISEDGGGKVVVPEGEWSCGKIHMKDNTELHFEKGAYVRFSSNPDDYLPVVFTGFEGIRCYNYSPLIYGRGLKNIAITGEGHLYGSGENWWDWKQNSTGINAIYTACMNDTPVEEREYGTKEYGLRPCFLQFVECSDVLIEGVTFENSPFWTVHPLWCDRVTVRGITLKNPRDSHNTDSVNIEGCNTVLVENCTVLGGGDDIFALKSGRGTDGWNVGKACENIEIRNCCAFNAEGSGIAIGSEMSGGVQNVYAHDCHFHDTFGGMRIKSKKGRGGFVRNIEYRNMKAEKVKYGISITLKYSYDDVFAGNGLEAMPEIGNIYYENYECDAPQKSIEITGVKDCHIKNIYMKDIKMTNAETAFCFECTDNINMENVSIDMME